MKNLRFLILTILLVSFAGLYGCYTQVATDEGRYSRGYHERDNEDSYGQSDSLYGYQDSDSSYYSDGGSTINNYYLYGDSYRPFYRRYYWGYHPGFSVGISLGWNDPWYYNPWGYAGWYDNYYYGDPFFYSSYYYNYPYFYPPYYGSYWGPGGGYGHYYGWGNWGNYKYRSNDFTRLRNSDGGRGTVGLRSRDLLPPARGTNRTLYKTRTQGDSRNTVVPRTGQRDVRSRDQQQGTLRKGNNNAPDQQRNPAVRGDRQRTNQGSYQRPRNEGSRNTDQRREGNNRGNSERKRSNYYNYYWPNQQKGDSAPRYNPPRQQQYNAPRREQRGNENRSYNPPQNRGGENRSYSPPQSRGDGGSRGGSAPQSRNSGGNDNGRRR
ncbi:MAG TPA: hypothetical protein VHO03_17390 [Ignavibacteriales bacterium]|nr:hypothetical protein [Ignavibacteriales bacterium]